MANSEEHDTIQNALTLVKHLEALLSGQPFTGITTTADKTEATIQMVAAAINAGRDVSSYDEFWVRSATAELKRRADERERVLQAAEAALTHRRMRPAKARTLAFAVLIAAGHPAFTDPLLAGVPVPPGTDAVQAS